MRVLPSKIGKVYLVGAGPGDPELLTLKGARCLQAADVVIYDRLVDPRILDVAPVAAERIFVGKKGGHYSFPQQKINELLARHARRGHQVVRLKGGDPLLLGRGGEEALYLAQEDIPFEVVPGVTSAVAVPASAGIPITHRGLSSSVTIVTGHQTADSESSVRWDRLARSADTLVVLMPLRNLRRIVSQLILNGRPLDTPAALIESGTLEMQRQVIAPLRSIVAKSAEAGIKSPALLVVGEVVHLSKFLAQSYQFSGSGQPPSVVLGAKKSS
ncbi:MAG: uroporphyrinogen-III C-methyltransferase [Acidobacteriota bacterium]